MRKIVLIALCVGLVACSSAKEQLGLNRQSPDEFKVVTRAPLEMPPDYNLRPPRPGAARPQEQSTVEAASAAVFGQSAAVSDIEGVTRGEAALLGAAGGQYVDPNIRARIDADAQNYSDANKPVIDRLMNKATGKTEVSAEIVDAKAERERIEANQAAGKPVTDSETPSIED